MKKPCLRMILVFFLVFSLVISITPAAPSRAAETALPGMDRTISDLLSLGDYVEGTALAVVRGTAAFEFPAKIERLSSVNADTVSSALEKNIAGGYVSPESAKRFSADDEYTLYRISDSSLTTEALLENLFADERVLSAEPDYRLDAPASFGQTKPSTLPSPAQKEMLSSSDTSEKALYEDNANDLTPYQWYLAYPDENSFSTPEAPDGAHYSLNVPGWNENETNASGTIAIMDTGIDTTHPDLQGVLFEFSKEQQERFGCGPYGKNVNVRQVSDNDSVEGLIPEEEYQKDITDHMMHGTHIAGIIAGLWNDSGISGIVNGAKIFGVRVYSDDGVAQSSSDIVRGFEWLTTVAKEVNLKAVNVSLGTLKPQLVHTIMVNKLGELGVNTVYASGNMGLDLDEDIDLGGENNSPFAITVNAANQDGKKTQFSCYGQMSTDVFAPGAQILSSTPSLIEALDLSGDIKDAHPYVFFYPDTTDPAHLVSGKIEKFETDDPSVLFFDQCPVNKDGSSNKQAKQVGIQNKDYGFDDSYSYEIDFSSLPENESENRIWMNSSYPLYKGVWIAIPAVKGEEIKWAGGKGAFNDESHLYCGVASVLCAKKNKDGTVSPENIDMRFDDSLKRPSLEGAPYGGLACSATMNFSSSQWAEWSLDLEEFAKGAAYFHTVDEDTLSTSGIDLFDPGELTGPYLWENEGQKYVLLQLGIVLQEGGTVLGENTRMLIDDIALGDNQSSIGAYTYLCGTSMAAPCVTASLAVIANGEPESKDLSDKELKNEALERAAKLLASVDYDDDLASYCRTGGRVNLRGQTEFTKKAPIIERAEAEDSTLTITGYFFGNSGELFIDGKKISVGKWTDTKITASLGNLSNGTHLAKIVNADKAVSQILFASSADPDDISLYEENLSLPLDDPDFTAEYTDGFAGAFVSLEDSLYVLSCDNTQISQGMWRYNISKDQWTHCAALPKKLKGMSVENNSLATADGMIYLYMYRLGLSMGTPQLWRYDPGKDSWSEVKVKDLCTYGQLISLDDRLLFLTNYRDWEESENKESSISNFNFIDTETGTLLPAEGDLAEDISSFGDMVVAASHEKLYMLFPRYVDDLDEELVLVRYSYDEKSNKFTAEDISASISEIIENKHNLAFCGLPDGIAILSPKTPGKDTFFLKDDSETVTAHERTSCYHKPFAPVAGCDGKNLYVLALNDTEPDVLYFRATGLPE